MPPAQLVTTAQFVATPFGDLVRDYTQPAQTDSLLQAATAAVEKLCRRRLAPFTLTETHRAAGVPYEGMSYVPLGSDQIGAASTRQFGQMIGVGQLVRQFQVREWPPVDLDLWTGALSALSLVYPWGGSVAVPVASADYSVDRGYVRFSLATFVPFSTKVSVTYTGGYSTTPSDLFEAVIQQAALLASVRSESESALDHSELRRTVEDLCAAYMKS